MRYWASIGDHWNCTSLLYNQLKWYQLIMSTPRSHCKVDEWDQKLDSATQRLQVIHNSFLKGKKHTGGNQKTYLSTCNKRVQTYPHYATGSRNRVSHHDKGLMEDLFQTIRSKIRTAHILSQGSGNASNGSNQQQQSSATAIKQCERLMPVTAQMSSQTTSLLLQSSALGCQTDPLGTGDGVDHEPLRVPAQSSALGCQTDPLGTGDGVDHEPLRVPAQSSALGCQTDPLGTGDGVDHEPLRVPAQSSALGCQTDPLGTGDGVDHEPLRVPAQSSALGCQTDPLGTGDGVDHEPLRVPAQSSALGCQTDPLGTGDGVDHEPLRVPAQSSALGCQTDPLGTGDGVDHEPLRVPAQSSALGCQTDPLGTGDGVDHEPLRVPAQSSALGCQTDPLGTRNQSTFHNAANMVLIPETQLESQQLEGVELRNQISQFQQILSAKQQLINEIQQLNHQQQQQSQQHKEQAAQLRKQLQLLKSSHHQQIQKWDSKLREKMSSQSGQNGNYNRPIGQIKQLDQIEQLENLGSDSNRQYELKIQELANKLEEVQAERALLQKQVENLEKKLQGAQRVKEEQTGEAGQTIFELNQRIQASTLNNSTQAARAATENQKADGQCRGSSPEGGRGKDSPSADIACESSGSSRLQTNSVGACRRESNGENLVQVALKKTYSNEDLLRQAAQKLDGHSENAKDEVRKPTKSFQSPTTKIKDSREFQPVEELSEENRETVRVEEPSPTQKLINSDTELLRIPDCWFESASLNKHSQEMIKDGQMQTEDDNADGTHWRLRKLGLQKVVSIQYDRGESTDPQQNRHAHLVSNLEAVRTPLKRNKCKINQSQSSYNDRNMAYLHQQNERLNTENTKLTTEKRALEDNIRNICGKWKKLKEDESEVGNGRTGDRLMQPGQLREKIQEIIRKKHKQMSQLEVELVCQEMSGLVQETSRWVDMLSSLTQDSRKKYLLNNDSKLRKKITIVHHSSLERDKSIYSEGNEPRKELIDFDISPFEGVENHEHQRNSFQRLFKGDISEISSVKPDSEKSSFFNSKSEIAKIFDKQGAFKNLAEEIINADRQKRHRNLDKREAGQPKDRPNPRYVQPAGGLTRNFSEKSAKEKRKIVVKTLEKMGKVNQKLNENKEKYLQYIAHVVQKCENLLDKQQIDFNQTMQRLIGSGKLLFRSAEMSLEDLELSVGEASSSSITNKKRSKGSLSESMLAKNCRKDSERETSEHLQKQLEAEISTKDAAIEELGKRVKEQKALHEKTKLSLKEQHQHSCRLQNSLKKTERDFNDFVQRLIKQPAAGKQPTNLHVCSHLATQTEATSVDVKVDPSPSIHTQQGKINQTQSSSHTQIIEMCQQILNELGEQAADPMAQSKISNLSDILLKVHCSICHLKDQCKQMGKSTCKIITSLIVKYKVSEKSWQQVLGAVDLPHCTLIDFPEHVHSFYENEFDSSEQYDDCQEILSSFQQCKKQLNKFEEQLKESKEQLEDSEEQLAKQSQQLSILREQSLRSAQLNCQPQPINNEEEKFYEFEQKSEFNNIKPSSAYIDELKRQLEFYKLKCSECDRKHKKKSEVLYVRR